VVVLQNRRYRRGDSRHSIPGNAKGRTYGGGISQTWRTVPGLRKLWVMSIETGRRGVRVLSNFLVVVWS